MVIEITPSDAAAHGLPAIGFTIDGSAAGMSALPFPEAGSYVTMSGPPGGVSRVEVWPLDEATEGKAWTAIAARFARIQRPIEPLAEEMVQIAGAARPAALFFNGRPPVRAAWVVALVNDPGRPALLVAFGVSCGSATHFSAPDVLGAPALQGVAQSFTLRP